MPIVIIKITLHHTKQNKTFSSMLMTDKCFEVCSP